MSAATPGIGNAVKEQLNENGIDINSIREEADKLLRQTGNPNLNPDKLERQADKAGQQAETAANRAASNPQAADDIAGGLLRKLFREGQTTISSVDREDAVNVVTKRTGKTRPEAEQAVDGWITTYEQAVVKLEKKMEEATIQARHAADAAASAASKAALFGFLGFLIGVIAAGYGAKMGTDSIDNRNRFAA